MESSDMPEIENSDEHVHDDDVEAVFRTKDHRVISLLFGIRTEILGLAKKVESTNKHVEDIHTRLLEPDEGLFARPKVSDICRAPATGVIIKYIFDQLVIKK